MPEVGKMYRVKGDANEVADDEKVAPESVIGKVMFKIPQLGKLQFFLASKKGWLLAIIVPAIIIIFYDVFKLIRLINLRNRLVKLTPDNI